MAVPASQEVLCRYVSHLTKMGLKHRTIKTYLSAVQFLHIAEVGTDLFKLALLRLEYILRGQNVWRQKWGGQRHERLPITPSILTKLKTVWNPLAKDPNIIMVWAACCLGFFWTVPSDNSYDPAVHLSWGDVAVDNSRVPTILKLTLKQSKTDPIQEENMLVPGKDSHEPILIMCSAHK